MINQWYRDETGKVWVIMFVNGFYMVLADGWLKTTTWKVLPRFAQFLA